MTLDEFLTKLESLKLRLEPGEMIRFQSPLHHHGCHPRCPIAAVVESETRKCCSNGDALGRSPLARDDSFRVLFAADDPEFHPKLRQRLLDCAWTDEKEAAEKLIKETSCDTTQVLL